MLLAKGAVAQLFRRREASTPEPFGADGLKPTRLKILGHARVKDAREYPDLLAQLASPEVQNKVERLVFIEIVSFDWNCPQYITPRYTIEEMKDVMIELQQHVAELNTEIKA
jgi:uncharacterized protein